MKKQIFIYLGLIIFLLSCCNDDDDGGTDTSIIIGKWILDSTTELDYNQNTTNTLIGCNEKPTMLTFDNETKLDVNSMVVVQSGVKLCVSGDSDEVTNNTIKLIEGTFPPPKNEFTYILQNNNNLTLTDAAGNIFRFIKEN